MSLVSKKVCTSGAIRLESRISGLKPKVMRKGIATRWAAQSRPDDLSIVFSKRSTLGTFACLRFSLHQRVCVHCVTATRDAFSQVCESFQRGRSGQFLQTEGYRAPHLLSFDFALLWSHRGCSAENLGSEDPEYSQADLRGCCSCCWSDTCAHITNKKLRSHLGDIPRPPDILLSAPLATV